MPFDYTLLMPKPAPKALMLVLLSCLLLTACGNKGPLVRPEASSAEQPVEPGVDN